MDPASPVFIPQNFNGLPSPRRGMIPPKISCTGFPPAPVSVNRHFTDSPQSSPVSVNKQFTNFRPTVSPQNMVNAHNSFIQEQQWRTKDMEEAIRKNFQIMDERYGLMCKQIHEQNFAINDIHREMMKTKAENIQLHNIIRQLHEDLENFKISQKEEMENFKSSQKEEIVNLQKISPKKKWRKK